MDFTRRSYYLWHCLRPINTRWQSLSSVNIEMIKGDTLLSEYTRWQPIYVNIQSDTLNSEYTRWQQHEAHLLQWRREQLGAIGGTISLHNQVSAAHNWEVQANTQNCCAVNIYMIVERMIYSQSFAIQFYLWWQQIKVLISMNTRTRPSRAARGHHCTLYIGIEMTVLFSPEFCREASAAAHGGWRGGCRGGRGCARTGRGWGGSCGWPRRGCCGRGPASGARPAGGTGTGPAASADCRSESAAPASPSSGTADILYFIVELEGAEGPDILVTLGESVVRLLLERLISVSAVRGEKAVSASRCSRQLVRESEVRRRRCGPRNTAPSSSCSWLPSTTSTYNEWYMRQENVTYKDTTPPLVFLKSIEDTFQNITQLFFWILPPSRPIAYHR